MKYLICCLFLLSLNVKADPLKKVLKRSDYCSPLQKMLGNCGKKKKEEVEPKKEVLKLKKSKKEAQKEDEEADEFLR